LQTANSVYLPEISDYELLQAASTVTKARENLLDYAEYVNPEYVRAPHNKLIAEKLEGVLRGEIRRLMIFVQPRSGKSHLTSQIFPTYALGKYPKLNIIQTGYSADISLKHSRLARDIMCSPEYRRLFPESIHRPQTEGQRNVDTRKQSAHEWGTVQGGSYYAVGIGGGVTGRGGNIILIDDPVKNRQDAESPLIQSRVLDWYRSTLYTRLEYPLSAIIIIMQRWSPHDLAGVLLNDNTDDWDVVILPAEAEENDPLGRELGAPLWDRCPIEELHRIRDNIGSLEYSALYQQRPRPRGGSVFREEWIKYIDHDPGGFPAAVRSWDLATTAKTSSDYTAGALIKRYDKDYVISNVVRAKLEFPAVKQLICDTARRDGKFVEILIEGGGMQTAIVQEMTDILQKDGYRVVQWKPKGRDKYVIALSTVALFEAGRVSFVRGEWNKDTVNELLCFTGAPNSSEIDDVVDTITHGIIHLDNRVGTEQPPATIVKRKSLNYG